MLLNDETQSFSPQDLQELQRFLQIDLLVTERELRFLQKIIIRDDGVSNSRGYWRFWPAFKAEDPSVITALAAVIVLNAYYLKTLAELKQTLAHEYGHHWTLCYLVLNRKFNIYTDRIPKRYYALRGLDPTEYQINYTNRQEWKRCDREVLAEDYRACFAPRPHNLDHQMVPPLLNPSPRIKTYIKNLQNPLPKFVEEPVTLEANRLKGANPFYPLTGRIEQTEFFFNRQRELQEIFDLLNGGSSVELLGERRIGKSSVLWQVQMQAEAKLTISRKPVYLNLQEVHTEAEFYQAFCEKLGIATCTGYELFRAMRDQRVLLLLDEAEKMAWDGFTRGLREQLRSLAEGGNAPLRLVVAARTPLDRLFPDSDEMTSPFHGICIVVELKPWDRRTATDFIQSRLAKVGGKFTQLELENLWQESLGHPQTLMQACFQLFQHYSNP